MTDYETEFRTNPQACGEPFPELIRFFDQWSERNAAVLDLGCGQGRDALMIAERGHSVHGVDLSPTGVAQMMERARSKGLSVSGEVADLREFTQRETFGAVLLDRVVHMFRDPADKKTVLETAAAATSVGGFLLIVETPSNLALVERTFENRCVWELVFSRKGFRFFKRLKPCKR